MTRFTSLQTIFDLQLPFIQESINIIMYVFNVRNREDYQSSFFPSTIRMWSSLPSEITMSLADFTINEMELYLYLATS